MAWSITSLANFNVGGGAASSQTTSTLSIPANSVILVFAHGGQEAPAWYYNATLSVSDSVDGATGWIGLDMQIVPDGNDLYDGGGRAFYKSFTSSTSRTITMAVDTGTLDWGYSVVAVTGQDTANPIVQAKGTGAQWSDAGSSHSQSVTLDSSPSSDNAVVWFLGVNNDSIGAAAIPSGYNILDSPSAIFEATSAAYHTATTAATITTTDCGEAIEYAIVFAVELKAAGGSGDGGIVAPWFRM